MATGKVSFEDPLDFQEMQRAVEKDIQAALEGLATQLVARDYCDEEQAGELAKGILLKGDKLRSNSPDDKDPPIEIPPLENKFYFLFILAPTEPEGSYKRPIEVRQRQFEAKNFLEKEFKLEGRLLDKVHEYRVVESYNGMMEKVKDFIKNKAKTCEKPFILFLGHGSNEGHLCFAANDWVLASTALTDISDFYDSEKTSRSPKLRLVFTQCFGHLIDTGDNVGTIQPFGENTEYIYLSHPKKDETVSSVIICKLPKVAHLQKFDYPSDIHLHLHPSHLFVLDAAKELRRVLTTKSHSEISELLLDGETADLPSDMRQAVEEKRKKMKLFLCVNYSEARTDEVDNIVDQLIDPFFYVDVTVVTADGNIRDAVRRFLTGSAQDVAMPVIIVKGKGRVEENELQLVLNDDTSVSADNIYTQHRNVDEIKMVFCCHDEEGATLMFSNALPPPITNSTHIQLMRYAYVILGQ